MLTYKVFRFHPSEPDTGCLGFPAPESRTGGTSPGSTLASRQATLQQFGDTGVARRPNLRGRMVPGPCERGTISGAQVTEIYSLGILSPGSAFNLTTWSHADRVGVAVLSDDRTFDDICEVTDAMVHALASFNDPPEYRATASRRSPPPLAHLERIKSRET